MGGQKRCEGRQKGEGEKRSKGDESWRTDRERAVHKGGMIAVLNEVEAISTWSNESNKHMIRQNSHVLYSDDFLYLDTQEE